MNKNYLTSLTINLTEIKIRILSSTISFKNLCYGQWNIKGSGSLDTPSAVKEVVKMMQSNKFDLTSLISQKYSVEDIEEALNMAANPDKSQRVVISFME